MCGGCAASDWRCHAGSLEEDIDEIGALVEELLTQALGHVMVNALQHAAGEVRVGVAVARGEVRIVVDDDGAGIAAADRQRALTPFTRLDGTRARRGHGLAPAIAARIVAQHRGTVEIGDSPLGVAGRSL